MPDIRYVCLSDMHLGAKDSLLTNLKDASANIDPLQPSPVARRLVECLRYLISRNEEGTKPTLILNGDILELALATTNQAAMVFERFVELIMPSGEELFEKIVYIPGNHDHHLWEAARETQYLNYVTRTFKPGDPLPIPWHATNMFVENDAHPVPSNFLTSLIRRYPHLKGKVIHAAYPNFGLFRKESEKCVIFHHGHYAETIYQLMSILKNLIFPDSAMPRQVWDLEAENFAWIDFFWSALGQSGEAGKDLELIYNKMQDKEQFKKLLYSLADSLAKKYDLPGWGDVAEAQILKWLFGTAVDKAVGVERAQIDACLSEGAKKGLAAYITGPLKEQILIERNQNMPLDVTFVFGHTHKPFQKDWNFDGYPDWVSVYNTGGWVVDTVEPQHRHGGAVILVDENLNAISLRMYNESENPNNYSVAVEEATHPGKQHNLLHRRISELFDPTRDPWKTFSETVSGSVPIRAQNLQARIKV